MADGRITGLAGAAYDAMARGAFDNAERLWRQVLDLAPDDPRALLFLGQRRLQLRDPRGAAELLKRAAAAAAPKDPIPWLNLSFAYRALGDAPAEMAALQRSLAADPYCFLALLAQGDLQERSGNPRQAARIYANVLKIAPPEDKLVADVRARLDHARTVVAQTSKALDEFLEARLKDVGAVAASRRMDEARAALVGAGKIYKSEASLFHIPRLPAIPYFDRALFPWLATVEAATDAIREELLGLLRAKREGFAPYVQYGAGAPLHQWAELNNSPRWSALFLWKDGARVEENCALCPRTVAAMEAVPLARIPGGEPCVLFSALDPHTRIPPHAGISNARAVVHLPLIIPPGCHFRVGGETRAWKEGEAWVFDDTIEHEAWNDSDQLRVIMIFNVWNPFLDEAEHAAAAALVSGFYRFYDGAA
ncbi:MAG: aspartyl/asparaginyl beta-hydroxylase domain-containing protein [Rhizomicrobium sp.]